MQRPESPEVVYCPLPTDDASRAQGEDVVDARAPTPPIFRAIRRGDEIELRSFVKKSPEMINQVIHEGMHPLHAATHARNLRALTLLLEEGAQVNKTDVLGCTALHVATNEEWQEGMDLLLRHGANANAMPELTDPVKGVRRETPLHIAIRRGDIRRVQILLQGNADLSLMDSDYSSVFHLAALARNTTLLRMFLAKKECEDLLHVKDINGNSALHSVLLGEDMGDDPEEMVVECLNLLLDEGMDVNSLNKEHESVLLMGARRKMPVALKLLLRRGANPKFAARDGTTLLHAASASGCSACLGELLQNVEMKYFVTQKNCQGKTPFELAVSSCALECCQILLSSGDHLGRRDHNGKTMCSLALRQLPGAHKLLAKVFDEHLSISEMDTLDPEFSVTFNFSPLILPEFEDMQNSLLCELMLSETEGLLKHPLVEGFLYLKWRRIKPFFYFNAFLYFVFLILHSAYIILTFGGNPMSWREWSLCLMTIRILFIIMFVLNVIPNIIDALVNWRLIFRQWETFCKAVVLVTSFYIVFSSNVEGDSKMVVETHLAAISSFFGWVELMILLGRFPSVGVYILMFSRVAKGLLTFIMAFFSLLVGFAIAFHVLMKDISAFSGIIQSFSKTLMMMIGEIDFSDMMNDVDKDYKYMVVILIIVFLFLVSILMTNLLIGLAVNDIPALQHQGKIHRLAKEASYLVSYERLLTVFSKLCCFPAFLRRMIASHCKVPSTVEIKPNKRKKYHLRKSKNYIHSEALTTAIQIATSTSTSSQDAEAPVLRLLRHIESKTTRDRQVIERKLGDVQESCKQHSCSEVARELQTLREQLQNQANLLNQILNARTQNRIYQPFSGMRGTTS